MIAAISNFLRFSNLREMYRAVFWKGSRDPKPVKTLLEDLREFCRADTSCIVIGKDGRVDTHATAVCEGRREVYLRIIQTLNLSDSVLNSLKETENDD